MGIGFKNTNFKRLLALKIQNLPYVLITLIIFY